MLYAVLFYDTKQGDIMQEITLDTKIATLLSDYDDMKNILIEINPKFKKLNNPVLRRTLAKIAGVRQAAVVGGMDPLDLLNQLRVAVGQRPVEKLGEQPSTETKEAPEWVNAEPKQVLDANEILDRDGNPLVELHKGLKSIQQGEFIVIKADFQPEPLIDEMVKSGHEVYVDELGADKFVTYILK